MCSPAVLSKIIPRISRVRRLHTFTRSLPGDRLHYAGDGPRPVRAGSAWPLVSDRSARRGSGVKRDFAYVHQAPLPVLIFLRSQSRLRLERRARTLSRAIPGSEPARTLVPSVCCVPPPARSHRAAYQLGNRCRPGFHRGRSYVPDADPGGLGSLTSQNSCWLPGCRE